MAISAATAADVARAALNYFVRGDALAQTIQDKPLLRILNQHKKSFPGGKDDINTQVQGDYMSAQAGFFAGYNADDVLAYKLAANIQRVTYPWKEVFAGLVINWTELKIDGVHISESGGKQTPNDASRVELTRLTGILKNRVKDYTESWSRKMNDMLWRDGSQDAKAVPGLLSILTDTPDLGTTGGLSRVTNTWWRHRTAVGASKITASAANQTLSKFLRTEIIQLRRFGGKPRIALCGSGFLEALRLEVQEKGYYTQTGFSGAQNIKIGTITLDGLDFEYDPTLDDLLLPKRCYIFDPDRITQWPMEDEENKMLAPVRPHDQHVFLQGMTWTGGLCATQLNCNAVYEVA